MESQEFNLSVLENATTFSTPLKDCSDYEAILGLIKEEIDISQTEDEGDDQSHPNNASRPRARRPNSESHDYHSKFKLPYGINNSAKTKSPGATLLSRTKHKSHDDLKNDTKKLAAQRAITLGHVMPRRSLKSTCRQHRSSGCYSDTSGFSDHVENGKTLNGKSLMRRKKMVYDTTDAYETEGEALEELLTMAQEQVIINGSPCGRNSTVSSQGESTSLATSDPLDTGPMEEECYVESSQPVCVSDFRKKLLNHRSIYDMPKNVEMIKRNLHFSDAPESEEDNQNFSLALSPEPMTLLNADVDGNLAPVARRKRKESQDSVASILNSLTSSLCNFYSQSEASTTPPRPRMGKSSQDSIARAFNSSTPNSYDCQNQGEASRTSQPSSMSKSSRESTPGIQNITFDLRDLERERQASTTPQPCMRKTSRESTPSTASTLNLIHDLEELQPKREPSTTPEPCTRKTRKSSITSTASTLYLPHDLQDLELKREASTPQYSNTSEASRDSTVSILKNPTQNSLDFDPAQEASTARELSSIRKTNQDYTPSALKNLAQDLQDLDPAREVSTALQPSSMSKTTQDSTPGILKNLTKDLEDLDPERNASTTLEPSSMRKPSQDSTASVLKNVTQDLPDLDSEREANTRLAPSTMHKTSQDSTPSTLENLLQDLQDSGSKMEANTALQPSNISKTCQDSTYSTSKNLTQQVQNFDPEKEASASLPHPKKRKNSRHSRDTLLKNLTQEFDLNNVDSVQGPSVTPLRSRERKMSQGSTDGSRTNWTREMQNLEPEREADVPSLHPGKPTKVNQDSIDRTSNSLTPNSCNSDNQREASPITQPSSLRETSQDSTANIQESVPQDLQNFDSKREAITVRPRSRHRKTSQDSIANSQESLTQDLQNLNLKENTNATPPYSRDRRTSQNSTASSQNSFTPEMTNFDSVEARQVTPARPRKPKTSQASTASSAKSPIQEPSNVGSAKEASVTPLRPRHRKTSQDSIVNSQESLTEDLQNLDFEREASATPPYPTHLRTSQNSMATSQKSFTQEPSNFDSVQEARQVTPARPRKRKTSQASTVSSEKTPTLDPSNVNSAKEASVTPPRPKKKKKKKSDIAISLEGLTQGLTSQASITSSAKSSTRVPSNIDSAKEVSATRPRAKKKKKKKSDIAISLEGLTQGLTSQASITSSAKSPTRDPSNIDSAQEVSVTPLRPRHRKTSQDSIANSRENLTENLENLDFKREASATPPYPRHRRTSQNSIGSSQKSFIQEPSNFDSIQEARQITPARPRKRKTSQASTVSSEKRSTRDPSNVDSAKESSVTPPRPKKKRKKKSDIAISLEGLTQDPSNVNPAEEVSLPPPRSQKRKKNKTSVASPPNIVTQDVTDLVLNREASMAPPCPRQRQSSVTSPLKGLTQELENCIMNVDFDRLCEEIDNDTESPSFTFETVQMLDDYDDCNPAANNKILSKILASPNSKTDEEAPRSVEHIGSSEDWFDYDPLYITEAEDNETAIPSTSTKKEKTGTKKTGNEIKRLTVDKSVKESERRIDKNDTLEGGIRRSSRLRKQRVTMTMSDSEEEVDVSDKVAQVPKKINSSSEDLLDYDALYITEAEDNETATPSTSKRKQKTLIKKKRNKRKSLPVDKSVKKSESKIDKDGTLEEGTRRSSRTVKQRVIMTMSDFEEEVDLSDEAVKVARKVIATTIKERLPLATFKKLKKIAVQLRHKVLPQHNIEQRAGTTTLTYEQQMRFLDFASLNKDIYSPAEDEIIKRNWNAFCVDHDWDPQNYRVFLQFKHGDQLIMSSMDERRKFVQFLADGLPNRPLYSVYNRFKHIYSEYADVGEWYSPEEDKQILAYMLYDPHKKPETKFAELSKVLKRPRDSIWKRYRNLKQKESCDEKSKIASTKVEWRLPLVTEFIKKLLDVTISDDLMELKDAFIPIVVWRKLEEKIEIDYNFMKRSWEQQFHMQFFCPEPLSANATKIKLIEYMWMKGIRHGSEIEWHVVVKYFDGCTISFLRKMFNHLTAAASETLKSRNLSDIMKWLHEIKIGRLRRTTTDNYLPRLRYVDKRVEIVPEDMTKITLVRQRASLG